MKILDKYYYLCRTSQSKTGAEIRSRKEQDSKTTGRFNEVCILKVEKHFYPEWKLCCYLICVWLINTWLGEQELG
jgi:hypothetical protein